MAPPRPDDKVLLPYDAIAISDCTGNGGTCFSIAKVKHVPCGRCKVAFEYGVTGD